MRINKLTTTILVLALATFYSCGSGTKANNKPSTVNEIKAIETMASFNDIINGNTPVLVDFYADWCAPCKMMAPIMQQVSKDLEGKVKVIKVNVDKNEDAARKYQIRSIPTMILFKNGKAVWQGVGVMQANQIKAIIEKNS